MKIVDREIGPGHPVYIIAEAGLAHLGSLDLAMEMLHAAKEAGADAFKTQWWKAINSFSLYSGPRKMERCLSLASISALARECQELGMHFLCTPHDEYALEKVAEICPAIKIGSGERGNWEFIEKAISYGLPLIVSLGGYSEKERTRLGSWVWSKGSVYTGLDDLTRAAFLFCISKYPTTWEDVKGQMPDFRNSQYDGWSSHTGDNKSIDFAAVAAGAKIIEKHIKPDIAPEPKTSMDMRVSIEAGDFKWWCAGIRHIDELFS